MKPLTYIVFVLFILNFVLFAFGASSQFTLSGFMNYASEYTGFNPDSEYKTIFIFGEIVPSDFTISNDWGAFNFLKLAIETIVRSLSVFYRIGDFVVSILKAIWYVFRWLTSLLAYFFSFI